MDAMLHQGGRHSGSSTEPLKGGHSITSTCTQVGCLCMFSARVLLLVLHTSAADAAWLPCQPLEQQESECAVPVVALLPRFCA
jgi:hypothetical protein